MGSVLKMSVNCTGDLFNFLSQNNVLVFKFRNVSPIHSQSFIAGFSLNKLLNYDNVYIFTKGNFIKFLKPYGRELSRKWYLKNDKNARLTLELFAAFLKCGHFYHG